MADNASLGAAKTAKNDEFYTQYSDIEAEMNAYVEYNPDVFRGKTILCPCDDPEWSNFTKYFASNFERFGLKKLISTSYAKGAGNKQLTMFEESSPLFDMQKHDTHGKVFTITRDKDGSGNIDTDDIEFDGYLDGDGDFRSAEVCRLRDEADIIITNPPFSLFREFLAWIMEAGKQFIIIGNMNAITYKELFQWLMNNKLWLGTTTPKEFITSISYGMRKNTVTRDDGVTVAKFGNVCWFTNIDHYRRHNELILDTAAHNLKYNKKLRKKLENDFGLIEYMRYGNYDAIEVPFAECIPSDYDGVMGVPISFLNSYNPDQFEILGLTYGDLFDGNPLGREFIDAYRKNGGTGHFTANMIELSLIPPNGNVKIPYRRLLIRHKKGADTQ